MFNREEIKGQAIANIQILQMIFTDSFAIYGTALGSLREKNIISHDLDTDIGIMSKNFHWEQLNKALDHGFKILSIFGMRHYGMEIALLKAGIKTDIMLFYEDLENPEKLFNCLWDNGGRNGLEDQIIHEYDQHLFNIINGELAGSTINTLGQPYIEHVYGKDWQTPIKKWDWRTDHLCKKTG